MQIGMDQFLIFDTGWTSAARIIRPVAVCTIDVLGISNGKSELVIPLGPAKKLGMTDPLIPDGPDQPLLDFFIPLNF